jgi:hypothetical protein
LAYRYLRVSLHLGNVPFRKFKVEIKGLALIIILLTKGEKDNINLYNDIISNLTLDIALDSHFMIYNREEGSKSKNFVVRQYYHFRRIETFDNKWRYLIKFYCIFQPSANLSSLNPKGSETFIYWKSFDSKYLLTRNSPYPFEVKLFWLTHRLMIKPDFTRADYELNFALANIIILIYPRFFQK